MPPPASDPVTYARETSNAWLGEVAELRDTSFLPGAVNVPGRYREALVEARARLDRLEEILSQAQAMKGGLARKATEAETVADDRWDEVAERASRTASRGPDFEGARERYARFNIQVLDERREARQWRLAADLASDAADRIRSAYYGLRDVRGELIEHLRAFALESNLDR